MKFRRLSILTLVTLALVSCAKNMPDPVDPEPMVFSAVASHSTKSIITTTNYPLDEPFAVEAVYYPDGELDAKGRVFIQGQKVSYDFGSYLWKTDDDYFWPDRGLLQFFAGSPIIPEVTLDPERGVEADWIVDSAEATQTDLCFGEVVEQCEAHSAAVPIVFSHALSQVCFKARTIRSYSSSKTVGDLIQANVISVVLDSVMVRGIYCKGHFTQHPLAWTHDSSYTADYMIYRSNEGLELRCDRYENPILYPLATMLLIPQDLPEEALFQEWHHMVVRTSITDKTTGEIVSDMTYSVPGTSTIPIAKYCRRWLMDYKYTFRIAVGLDDSELTTAVTDWTETKEIILGDE